MSKHVLVAYGSKRGGTAGLAQVIADSLRQDGCTVVCKPADEVSSLAGYDAAIIGGALYMGRWHRAAWRFCRQHEERLRELPVWLFSSGPLDDSASAGDISPTGQVARLMTRIGARGHVTFGGRLAPDARGWIASAMAKTQAGDWRDWTQVRAWACRIAAQIQVETDAEVPTSVASPARHRWLLVALCAFVALTAMVSSVAVPGLVVLGVIGAAHAIAAVLVAARRRIGTFAAFTGGIALTVWIVGEMVVARSAQWLLLGYLALGLAITALAFRDSLVAARAATDRASAGRSTAFAS